MNNSRLSLRLLIAAALSIFIAVAATGIAINYLFESFYKNKIGDELEDELNLVIANVSFDVKNNLLVEDLKNEQYLKPLSGRYWQVMQPIGEVIYSESLWDQSLPLIQQELDGQALLSRLPFSDSEILMISRWVKFDDGVSNPFVQISVARDLLVGRGSVLSLKKQASVWLGTLAIGLTVATWLQIYIGLKPLERIRTEVKDLKDGNISQLSNDFPLEVQPLVNEVNSTLKSKDKVIEKARFSAGNLAHGLKTPLTIINGLLVKLSPNQHDNLTKDIREQINNMNETIERELARVRTNEKSQNWTDVQSLTDKLIHTMTRLPRGDQIEWQTDICPNFKMPLDEHDFAELVGNVLDNARKFTNSVVLVKGAWLTAEMGVLSIEDNGKGIPTAQMMNALNRGERLHNASPGHGIGLSIVHELATSSNFTLLMSESALGGLKVTVEFPKQSPA